MLNLVEIKVSTIKQWINFIPSSEARLIWQVYRIPQGRNSSNIGKFYLPQQEICIIAIKNMLNVSEFTYMC